MSIDFIVINFHAEDVTWACIESIKALCGNYNKPIILVDNESESSESFIDLGPGIKVVRNKQNLGFAGGIKSALPFCNSELVACINNDAIVTPNWLEELAKSFSDSEVGLAGGKEEGSAMPYFDFSAANAVHKSLPSEATAVSFISGSNFIARRQLMDLWDDQYFLYYEDIDFCVAVKNEGFNIIFNPSAVVQHKVNYSTGKSPIKKWFYIYRSRYRFIFKFYPTKKLIPIVTKGLFEDTILSSLELLRYIAIGLYRDNSSSEKQNWRNHNIGRIKAWAWLIKHPNFLWLARKRSEIRLNLEQDIINK
jgi:GT2 family glycosyltransferase